MYSMLNRRGFLASMAAALGASALDPEWIPGRKLYSIPKTVHLPQWKIMGVTVELPVGFGFSSADDLITIERRYIQPAMEHLKLMVGDMAARGPIRLAVPEIPKAIECAGTIRSGNFVARHARAYDCLRDQMIQRVDVLVRS